MTPSRIRTARIVAMVADVLQLALFPAFAGGFLSPLNDALDIVVAVVLVVLVGWHFAFLPSFIAELLPGLDMIPTWTAAVWFATRSGTRLNPKLPQLPPDTTPPVTKEPSS